MKSAEEQKHGFPQCFFVGFLEDFHVHGEHCQSGDDGDDRKYSADNTHDQTNHINGFGVALLLGLERTDDGGDTGKKSAANKADDSTHQGCYGEIVCGLNEGAVMLAIGLAVRLLAIRLLTIRLLTVRLLTIGLLTVGLSVVPLILIRLAVICLVVLIVLLATLILSAVALLIIGIGVELIVHTNTSLGKDQDACFYFSTER